MQRKEKLEAIAKRFIDEVQEKLEYAEKYSGISGAIIVPVHPEIYANAVEALEIINELGKSRRIRVEQVEKEEQNYELKFIRLHEKQ